MVRQASCDVSDRNDKGSPDTVWQILGSYCSSFSCSQTSAAQTRDPARAAGKETLRSAHLGLCQLLQWCGSLLVPATAWTAFLFQCTCPRASQVHRPQDLSKGSGHTAPTCVIHLCWDSHFPKHSFQGQGHTLFLLDIS